MPECEQTNKEAAKHAREFRGVTEATAEVIMLPPEPPITRSLPDFDSSMTGVIEEGGRSPMTTITLQIRAKRGEMIALCDVFNSVASDGTAVLVVDVADFTCPHCVRPRAEVGQLIVEDDARSWRVNGSSKS